ncbi:hypothetical protein DRN97_07440, partial [Methanosarcinales archaeon]
LSNYTNFEIPCVFPPSFHLAPLFHFFLFLNLVSTFRGAPQNFVTGNTIVDAVYQNLEIARRKVNILNKLNLN